jgi:hypothetical protein
MKSRGPGFAPRPGQRLFKKINKLTTVIDCVGSNPVVALGDKNVGVCSKLHTYVYDVTF